MRIWVAAGAAALLACSGHAETELLAPDATPSRVGDSGTPASTDSSVTKGDRGGDAGPPNVDCPREREPNDTAETANPLVGSICGDTSPGATDVDYFTFTLQPSTQQISITFTGNIEVRLTVRNTTVILTPSDHPPIPFVRGEAYLVRVRSLDEAEHAYKLTVEER